VQGLHCRDCLSWNLGQKSSLLPLFFSLESRFEISSCVEDFFQKRRSFENSNLKLIMTLRRKIRNNRRDVMGK
jgi:hypothetical protein